MFKNYLKTALRHLLKYKSISLINIVGLVLGLFCTILIYSWIRHELSYDTFHRKANQLYRAVRMNEAREFFSYYQPGPLAEHLRDVVPEIIHTTSFSERRSKISYDDKGFFVIGSYVDTDFFDMFSYPLLQGDAKTALDNPDAIVLTASLAEKLFGDSKEVIGKTVKLNNNQTLQVTGLLENIPENSHMQFDFILPFKSSPGWMHQWNLNCTATYAMLAPNSSIDLVNKKIHNVMNQHNPEWNNVLFLRPFTKTHLYNLKGGGLITYIYIFATMGIVILFIACINFINLTTAYSEQRMKEICMRKTIGSSQLLIAAQFLVEAILLAMISMSVVIFLAELLSPQINHALGISLDLTFSTDSILMLLGVTVLTGLGAGLYPAIHFSKLKPVRMLASSSRTGTGGQSASLRKILVTVQYALSIFFIISMFGIRQQLHFILAKDLGYAKESIVVVHAQGTLAQKAPEVKKALLQLPEIENAAISGNEIISLRGTGSGPLEWPGKITDRIVDAGINIVDPDFLATLDMELTLGRFFSNDLETDKSDAFVVNETAVQQMGFTDPIGKEITFNQGVFKRTGRIIGVVKDYHTGSLHEPMYPIVMMQGEWANYLFIKLSSKQLEHALADIKNTIHEFVPDDPFHYEFFDQKIENQYQIEKLTNILTTYLTILMMTIACLGLFGLASFSTQQRTKEIGIRKVFGATVPTLLYSLSRDFTKFVLFANVIAWPIAWYAMNKWLQNFAYRVEMSWWMFALAGGLALVIALLTVSGQAIRAANMNPADALRYE